MNARAKILGHPVHQMLIVFPLGLLGASIIFDIAYLVSHSGRWGDIAFLMIAVGVISGLVAAVFGLIDWLAIPARTRAKRIGALHGLGNVVVALSLAALSRCYSMRPSSGGAEAKLAGDHRPDPAAVSLPPGYRIEPIAT